MATRTPVNRAAVTRARILARRASTTSIARQRRQVSSSRTRRSRNRARLIRARRHSSDAVLIAARIKKSKADQAARDAFNANAAIRRAAILARKVASEARAVASIPPRASALASRFALNNPAEAARLAKLQDSLANATSRSLSVATSLANRIKIERQQTANAIAAQLAATQLKQATDAANTARIIHESINALRTAEVNAQADVAAERVQITNRRISAQAAIRAQQLSNTRARTRILATRAQNNARSQRINARAAIRLAAFNRRQALKNRQNTVRANKITADAANHQAELAKWALIPAKIASLINGISDMTAVVSGNTVTCTYKSGADLITAFSCTVATEGGAVIFDNSNPRAFWLAKRQQVSITRTWVPGRYRYWWNRSYYNYQWNNGWNWNWYSNGHYVEVKHYNIFASAEKSSVAKWNSMVGRLKALTAREHVNISGMVKI